MLKGIISAIVRLLSFFKGKPKVTEILAQLMVVLPDIVNKAITVHGLDTKEKIDEALITIDAFTGVDEGALDIIHDLPADKEEAFFDSLVEAIRIMAYNKIKVPGYYQE